MNGGSMSQGRHECWLRQSRNTLMQQVKAARSRHLRCTTERVVFVFINSFQKTSSTSSQFLASPLGKPLSLPRFSHSVSDFPCPKSTTSLYGQTVVMSLHIPRFYECDFGSTHWFLTFMIKWHLWDEEKQSDKHARRSSYRLIQNINNSFSSAWHISFLICRHDLVN